MMSDYWKKLIDESQKVLQKEDGHTDVASALGGIRVAREALQNMEVILKGMNPEDDLPSWWTNKVATAVHLIHEPTGIEVRMQDTKSQAQKGCRSPLMRPPSVHLAHPGRWLLPLARMLRRRPFFRDSSTPSTHRTTQLTQLRTQKLQRRESKSGTWPGEDGPARDDSADPIFRPQVISAG